MRQPEKEMTRRALSLCDIGWKPLALLVLALWPGSAVFAADEPDLIFRRSTVFKLLSPNDKLATYGVDDPEVEGVACHFTVPERGGFQGLAWACGGSLGYFARLPTDRPDPLQGQERNVLVYMVYSDRLVEGSPKNSTSSVPIMPWGVGDAVVQKCGEFIQ
jgi:CreA protein